jgi:hypothetical protein
VLTSTVQVFNPAIDPPKKSENQLKETKVCKGFDQRKKGKKKRWDYNKRNEARRTWKNHTEFFLTDTHRRKSKRKKNSRQRSTINKQSKTTQKAKQRREG